jgi:hypothetical protein
MENECLLVAAEAARGVLRLLQPVAGGRFAAVVAEPTRRDMACLLRRERVHHVTFHTPLSAVRSTEPLESTTPPLVKRILHRCRRRSLAASIAKRRRQKAAVGEGAPSTAWGATTYFVQI